MACLPRQAALHDVTGLADYPRSAVNQEQFINTRSDQDVRALLESAREGALMERRRRNLSPNWLTSVHARTWAPLSHAICAQASPCRGHLVQELMSSSPRPTLAFNVGGLSWVIGEPLSGMLGRVVQ